MALSEFEKQDRLVQRLMKKCDNDKRCSITIVAENTYNIHDVKSHIFTLKYFVDGKKRNGYGLPKAVYDKYEADKRFELISASQTHCTSQYNPLKRV